MVVARGCVTSFRCSSTISRRSVGIERNMRVVLYLPTWIHDNQENGATHTSWVSSPGRYILNRVGHAIVSWLWMRDVYFGLFCIQTQADAKVDENNTRSKPCTSSVPCPKSPRTRSSTSSTASVRPDKIAYEKTDFPRALIDLTASCTLSPRGSSTRSPFAGLSTLSSRKSWPFSPRLMRVNSPFCNKKMGTESTNDRQCLHLLRIH